ncbi:MAG: hypothetical protein JWO67_1511 [Streptosporangiaceae bacterium]|nr:hypothetical protein [Streptosporangiaceae bacterium]
MSEYVVVVRARSSARFLPGQGQEVLLGPGPQVPTQLRIRLQTRWADEGFTSQVPRELVIEVRGEAPSLDAAVSHFPQVARPFAALLAFCANVAVGTPEAHIAYDISAGTDEREFLEVFLPDEGGLPAVGRIVRIEEYTDLVGALLRSTVGRRLGQALQHYELALRNWHYGGEYLAMAHLYMAVETLTVAILRDECHRRGLDQERLAREVGIDPDERRWKSALETWCRAELIFQGDPEAYRSAKSASDGLEHGILDLSAIHQKAVAAASATFGYVRFAILRLFGFEDPATELARRPPRDVLSMRKMVRGHFVGPAEDPAPAGEPYPRLEWNSSVKDIVRVGNRFNATFQEDMRVWCAPDIGFRGSSFEVRGRDDGDGVSLVGVEPVPVLDVEVTYGPTGAAWQSVLRRAQRFTTQIASRVAEVAVQPLYATFFGQISEALALAEAIEVLLLDRRPIESFGLLRGMVLCAARFETYECDPDSAVGTAARWSMESLKRISSLYSGDSGAEFSNALEGRVLGISELLSHLGLHIPEREVGIDATEIYREHWDAIRYIDEVEHWGELAISLHSKSTPEGLNFFTRATSDELIRMIAGTATRVLVYSAVIFAEIMDQVVELAEAVEIDLAGQVLESEDSE